MSDKISQYSRFEFHTITTSGTTFTVPSNEDNLNAWINTDLGLSEIGVNEGDEKAYLRIGSSIKEFQFVDTGSTITRGSIALTGGTANVFTSAVTTDSIIQLTAQDSGSGNVGFLRVSARGAGSYFRIVSSDSLDDSLVGWLIIEP